jgi:hypothetical protein
VGSDEPVGAGNEDFFVHIFFVYSL